MLLQESPFSYILQQLQVVHIYTDWQSAGVIIGTMQMTQFKHQAQFIIAGEACTHTGVHATPCAYIQLQTVLFAGLCLQYNVHAARPCLLVCIHPLPNLPVEDPIVTLKCNPCAHHSLA